jgi:hypothetical protein
MQVSLHWLRYITPTIANCARTSTDWPFRIMNILEVIGESMGLHRHDRYKELKIIQDADQIVADCSELIAEHSLDPGNAREVVVKVLLGDQPLPLKGGMLQEQRAGVVAPS